MIIERLNEQTWQVIAGADLDHDVEMPGPQKVGLIVNQKGRWGFVPQSPMEGVEAAYTIDVLEKLVTVINKLRDKKEVPSGG